jgi:hypothetical protein
MMFGADPVCDDAVDARRGPHLLRSMLMLLNV